MSKICSKCKKELPLSSFYSDKSTKDGYYPSCIKCKTGRKIEDEDLNKKLQDEWLKTNKPKKYDHKGELL